MVSKSLFTLLAALTLTVTAAPARAQDTDEPPDNPALVDVPPGNPELPSDKPLYLDPRLSIVLVGLNDQVAFGGGLGLDLMFRLSRHHAIAGVFSFCGAGQLNDYADGDRGRYFYSVGLAYVLRAHLDTFRIFGAVEFLELRDTADAVVLDGGTGSATIEVGGGESRWLGRLGLKFGVGWDWLADRAGFLYSAELSAAYSF